MFVLVSGSIVLYERGKPETKIYPVTVFGEKGLIRNVPRDATARAVQASIVYRLKRTDFEVSFGNYAKKRALSKIPSLSGIAKENVRKHELC